VAQRRRFVFARSLVLALLVIVGGAWWVVPLPDPPFPDDYSTVVLDADGEVLHAYLAADEQWRFRPDALEVSPKLLAAVVTFEDKRFYSHPGVDPLAVARAAWQNVRRRRVVSGASTLSMQVARLMRPKSRHVLNKLVEMLQALKLERRYSKDEILSMYLAHAPYGGNIVGAHAASFHYFGRPCSRLTWAEAAMLAVLPKAPGSITPFRNRGELKARRDRLLEELCRSGHFGSATLDESCREPLPSALYGMPAVAPHLCRRASRETRRPLVRTTLKASVQGVTERLVSAHASQLAFYGIPNVSALVAETPTGEVRAYVGSPDFADAQHGGQVDGVTAPRSTGSLLKPFLYALCMDAGTVHPLSLVKDVPVHYGSYEPRNASKWFDGMVQVRDALVRSLNVPPTMLLRDYKVFRFHDFLKRAGMTTLFRGADDYGLALILGGAEGTLWDMVTLYRGLGSEGRFGGLTYLDDAEPVHGEQLISPGSAWMTLNMLTDLRRPDDDGIDWAAFPARRPVAWKSGTSYGRRDGWAVGVTPQWVVGVWVGSFSGEGNPELGGARSAAPLLFSILDALPDGGAAAPMWFEKPVNELREVLLCRDTGYRAGPDCPHTVAAEVPCEAPPLRQCPYHRAFYVDPETGYEVCSRCWNDPDSALRDVRLVFPPDATQYMRRNGHLLASRPMHNPECCVLAGADPVRIAYPTDGADLVVPRDLDGAREKVTARAAHGTAGAELFWYVDGQYLGTTCGYHAKPLTLGRGRHELQVIDHDGHADRVTFTVACR
jgi:penicillin-binding protein 1C